MTEWFKEVFGAEPRQLLPPLPPPIDYDELNLEEIEFLEPHPRVVSTRMGPRAVIKVSFKGEERSLWLSRQGLANEVAQLEQIVGSLLNIRVKVVELPKRKRFIPYNLTIVSQ